MHASCALALALASLCTLTLAISACSSPRPQLGGETHWLRSCWSDDECGDELSCICGSCTLPCQDDGACAGGRLAACYDTSSPLLRARCAGLVPEPRVGICLPSCERASDCGTGRTCVQDACVPQSAEATGGDAAAAPAGSTRISDYDDVASEISWSDPPRLSERSLIVEGAQAGELLGSWEQCDPQRSCVHLEFAQDGSGVVRGVIWFGDQPAPQYPPAVDPALPYPPGASGDEIAALTSGPAPGFRYPLHDARIETGKLTFEWSHFDLFAGWCALQTPHPWTVQGHAFSFCAPQDRREQAAFDPVVVSLCVDRTLSPMCRDVDGSVIPCDCQDKPIDTCQPQRVCACDRERCGADHRSYEYKVVLELQGDVLKGQSPTFADSSFMRVDP